MDRMELPCASRRRDLAATLERSQVGVKALVFFCFFEKGLRTAEDTRPTQNVAARRILEDRKAVGLIALHNQHECTVCERRLEQHGAGVARLKRFGGKKGIS